MMIVLLLHAVCLAIKDMHNMPAMCQLYLFIRKCLLEPPIAKSKSQQAPTLK